MNTYNEMIHEINCGIMKDALEHMKLTTMFEMVEMKEQTMMREAAYKVYSESGTSDDLEFLYTEAETNASEKKRNILERIFDGITGIIKKIFDAIKDILNIKSAVKENNEPVSISEESVDKSVIDKIKDAFNKIPKSVKTAGAILSIGAIIAGVVAFLESKKNSKPKMIEAKPTLLLEMTETLEKVTEDINNTMENIKEAADNDNIKMDEEEAKDDSAAKSNEAEETKSEPKQIDTNRDNAKRLGIPDKKNYDRDNQPAADGKVINVQPSKTKIKHMIAEKKKEINRLMKVKAPAGRPGMKGPAGKGKANTIEVKKLRDEIHELEKMMDTTLTESAEEAPKSKLSLIKIISTHINKVLSKITSMILSIKAVLTRAVNR